jgi:hypothetical protein
MKWLTFMLVVAVAFIETACNRASVAPAPESQPGAAAISSRCQAGELLVAQNLEQFPIYYTIVNEPGRSTGSLDSQHVLGNTLAQQTDTLVEVNATVQRVIAWPDKAHQVPGPWGPTNRPNVRFTCVNA